MQLTRRKFASGIAAVAAAPTYTALAQSTPAASPSASDVETQMLAVMEELGVPGAVVGMITPESPEPVYLELGIANLETNEPISADMHFRIASVTKTYTATVILQLVDEGEISLDDTIADVLPDLNVVNTDIITIRHLLSMRSGLPQLLDNPEVMDFLADPTPEVTFADLASLVADLPAHADPDTGFEYNNINFNILGEMIDVITGEPWDANVETRILQPLGLGSTIMINTPDMPAPFAHGYGYSDQQTMVASPSASTPDATPVADGPPLPEATPLGDTNFVDVTAFNPTIAGAAGGLISVIADQLIWSQAFAAGELVSPELHAEQINGWPMDASGEASYGLGTMNIGGLIGHNGAINGFQSAILASPEDGISLAVLTNADPIIGRADASFELLGALLG